ncbi:MAG TPA: extracellular solute-binding protein [Gaiellales bacterium]|jgi:multiple sugar transport system substrate-binding protein|nr:extracellular solute-binding protein [Gaiellales bacterium]
MRRPLLAALACAITFSALATGAATAPAADHKPVTITFWSAYTTRELHDYQLAFVGFHQKYPWITVKGTGNIQDDKIIAAVNGGNAPDALLSFSPNNTGKFCSSGAWQNLNDRIKQDKFDLSQFPKVALSYSGYKGVQCSLPALADAYGLYMNTAMLKAAGFTQPPKTLSELTAMAKKLTVRGSNGSLKRIGLNPLFGHYETFADGLREAYGAPWFDAKGQPVLSKDPRWAALLKWQKSLVDWYGYDQLRKFTAASADEFGASNDFEIGRVAMQYDGEWRTAFIKNEHPELKYSTAPFPAADSQAGQYGAGSIAGDIVAIPKGSKHPDEAWLLVKYLASDTGALVGLSNRLKNLPTTTAANTSPKLTKDVHFATFFKIFTHPRSQFNPLTPIGQQYGDTFQAFAQKWQAGQVKDLPKGLQGLDKQISDELKQASAGSAP